LLRILRQRRGHFGWPIPAAKFDRRTKTLGKIHARRAIGKVRFDLSAGIWRQFKVEVLGKQCENIPAFL
jgi:hypothetical protein